MDPTQATPLPPAFIAIFGLIGVVVYLVLRALHGPDELAAAIVLDEYDKAMKQGSEVEGGRISKWSFQAAAAFRAQFGHCSMNKANRLLAHEFIRDKIRELNPDVRDVDLIRLTSRAVQFAFMPTQPEVEDAGMEKSRAWSERRGMLSSYVR